MLKKIFSHTVIYGLAPHVPKLASVFVLPIITKDLTANDYGIAGIIAAYTTAFVVLSTLGLRIVLVNSFYKSPSQFKWLWRQIYGFLSLWVIPYALLIAGVILFAIPESEVHNKWTIVVLNVIPIVLFGPTATIATTYYQLKQKPFQIGIRTAIIGIIGVFLNLYTISYLKMGYMGWFWSLAIVTVLTNISYWYPLNISLKMSPIFNFKFKTIKKALKISFPTIPHFYSGYLLESSDKMIMDLQNVSIGQIGNYNLAATFGGYVNAIAQASGLAIGPLLMESYKEKDEYKARSLVYLLQVSFFAGTFCLAIWIKEIFQIMINNDDLAKIYPLAIIIIMSYNYRPMYFGSINLMFYNEKTKILFRVTFVAGLINVGLNFIFIPMYGIWAAAITTFVAYMYMGYAGYFFKTFKEQCSISYYPIFWLFMTIVLVILAYFVVEFQVVYKIGITLVVLVAYMFFVININLKDEK